MTDIHKMSQELLVRRIMATARNLKLCRENLRYQQRSLEKYKRRCKDLEKIVSLMQKESAPSLAESIVKIATLIGFFIAGYAVAVHTLMV
jgi:phosphopantetheine adenylyltransferase